MSANENPQDPLAFLKNMWSTMGITLPGMVTPTLEPGQLDRRIRDLKTVEGWLRMNLTMLTATINTLEVQQATLASLKAFGQPASTEAGAGGSVNPFINVSLWPWNLMQQAATDAAEAAAASRKPEEPGR